MNITWPVRPGCHDGDPSVKRLIRFQGEAFAVRWREPDTDRPFRHCSFCSSIHPEDMMKGFEAGARAELSDMKYGWPHKHYIGGIPNPYAGQPTRVGSISLGMEDGKPQEPTPEQLKGYSDWTLNKNGVWQGLLIRPAAEKLRAKWYNEHMKDFDSNSFLLFEAMIRPHLRIEWVLSNDQLGWRKV